jgi:hypothetical protein
MSTKTLEGTGRLDESMRISSRHDLDELNDEELTRVSGGGFPGGPHSIFTLVLAAVEHAHPSWTYQQAYSYVYRRFTSMAAGWA